MPRFFFVPMFVPLGDCFIKNVKGKFHPLKQE